MKQVLITAALLTLLGCSNKPLEAIKTDNKEMVVEKLFTVEGCTVYRFRDTGAHYFTNCKGSTSTNKLVGKVIKHETISGK